MKKINLWKIMWIAGVYALLITILYLVILYKVQWEYKDFNTYLYFYDCKGNLCTSTTKQNDYYNKILCKNNICPYIVEIIADNLILKDNNNTWIYNYIDNVVVNNEYMDYRHIGDDLFVVTDNNKQGVIDLSGNLLIVPEYDYIDDYNNGFVSYIQNNLYGIDTIDNVPNVDAGFEDIVLINDELFAGMKDNVYYIYSYDNIDKQNNTKYDYVYAYDDAILVINNNKIDILTVELKSTLLMKINTFYKYTVEKERESLEPYSDGENIYFKVFVNENEYITYKYNIINKKLV